MKNGTKKTSKEPAVSRLYLLSNGKLTDPSKWKKSGFLAGSKAGESKEIKEDEKAGFEKAGSDFVPPPFNLDELAALLDNNTWHDRAVKAKAADSVGRGWELVKSTEGASDREGEMLREFFKRPNPRQSLSQILRCAVTDFEAIGQLGIEVVRDITDTPVELNHMPAKTLFVSRDHVRVAQVRGNLKAFFKIFGTEEDFEASTGNEAADGMEFGDLANEILWSIKYSPKSDFYGRPDIIPALSALGLDVSARNFNLDFFENWAVPAYVVTIEGGDLTPESKEYIEDFMAHEAQGDGNRHRTLVIPVPQEGVKITVKEISTEQKEGHFQELREFVRGEIFSAHGVPEHRAFIARPGSFGRDQSRELNINYAEQTIQPLQEIVEDFMNSLIVNGFGVRGWEFKLKGLAFENLELKSKVLAEANRADVLTTNEKRELLAPLYADGLSEVPGGDVLLVRSGGQLVPLEDIGSQEEPIEDATPPADPGEEGKAHDHGPLSTTEDYSAGLMEDTKVGSFERELLAGASQTPIRRKFREIEQVIDDNQKRLLKAFDQQRDAVLKEYDRQTQKRKSIGGRIRSIFAEKAEPFDINAILVKLQQTVKSVSFAVHESRDKGLRAGFKTAAGELGVAISFDIVAPRVLQFLREETEALSANINETISKRIRNQLQNGLQKGESLEEIGTRVGRVFDGNAKRALMIARTETARAYNMGTTFGYADSGLVSKVKVFDVGAINDLGCMNAKGQVWTLEVAASNPIEHPNCVRTFRPITKARRDGERGSARRTR